MIRRVLNENKQESQKLINSLKEEKKQYEDKLKRKDK